MFSVILGVWSCISVANGLQSQLLNRLAEAAKKYEAERTELAAVGEAQDRFQLAEQLKAKADAALKTKNFADAQKWLHQARWALPARPSLLPDHLERMIGYVRLRHSDRVNCIAYTPDGSKLVSSSRDGTARVWDLGNGRELLVYRGHTAAPTEDAVVKDNAIYRVPAVAIAPNGQSVASSGSGEIHLWNLATGQVSQKLTGAPRATKALAFSPDGKWLVAGSDDRIVRVWTVETGKLTLTFPAGKGRIESLAISPNSKLIAAVDSDGQCSFFKLDGSDPKPLLSVMTSDAAGQATFAVLFSPDGSRLFAAGQDTNPRLITGPAPDSTAPPGTGNVILRFPGHTGRIFAAARSADGKLFATSGEDKTVRVWDAATGKQIRQYHGLLSTATAITIRPDGKQLAAASDDGTIKLWSLSVTDEHVSSTDSTDFLWTTAYSPDGKTYATGGADRIVRVFDATTNKLLHKFAEHTGAVTAVVYLSNDRLVSASGDRTVKIWELATGKATSLNSHTAAVLAAATAGNQLITGSADKTVKGWDVATNKATWSWQGRSAVAAVAVRREGQQVFVGSADGWLQSLGVTGSDAKPIGTGYQAHIAGVAAIAISRDETRLATVGGDGKFILWSIAEDGSLTRVTKDDPPTKPASTGTIALSTVAFCNAKPLVAAAGADLVVHLYDANTGSEIRSLRGHTDWVTSVTFSPKGDKLLTVGVDKNVRIFDLETGESTVPSGHTKAVRAVAISPDGKKIASASDDQTVKVWELATGNELMTLTGAGGPLYSMTFVGNQMIAAGGQENRVRIWSLAQPNDAKTRPSGQAAYVVAASPDGKQIAVWSQNSDSDYSYDRHMVNGESIPPLVDTAWKATCATFSTDLSWAISGNETGQVRVWDLNKRSQIGSDWPIHTKRVEDVALTTDKSRLIAIDEEGTVKIADVAKREVVKTFAAIKGKINGIIVSPTDDRFAVYNSTGETVVYDFTGKTLRSWNLPTPTNNVAFTADGKNLVTANADGTVSVLLLP